MINFELVSSLTGALLFFALALLLVINWRGQAIGSLLITGCVMSILFFSCLAWYSNAGEISLSTLRILEILRDAAWLVLLGRIIKYQPSTLSSWRRKFLLPGVITGLTVTMITGIILAYDLTPIRRPAFINIEFLYYGYLLIALLGLILIEQIYRNTRPNYRWAIRYFCIGMGGIFIYDFLIYSDAVLFRRIHPDLWYARGAANAVCVPLMAVSIRRIREWKMELFVSRHVLFQSSMMLTAGIYLSFMAISGYYVRVFGGTWGGALQTVFLFAAFMGFLVLIFSSDLRARIRIFLVKHFYENKYDYRDEWLGFTRLLAESKGNKDIYANIVRAFSGIMKCGGGAMWLAEDDNSSYECVAELHLKQATRYRLSGDSNLIRFLRDSQWVINMDNYRTNPHDYRDLQLPDWIMEFPNVCLIFPLFNEERLIGFILLVHSDINADFNWEDYDLLKTMGNQAAAYIAFLKASENLAEAKQFEAFNRLSAFVVHDIKNLVAQLSLVSSNAKRFQDDPEFLRDAFDTIDNAKDKMNRLLRNLQKDSAPGQLEYQRVDLRELLQQVAASTTTASPHPRLVNTEPGLVLRTDKDKLTTIVHHLVQNAQEATGDDGKVEISLSKEDGFAVIQVRDTGSGMDEEFIRNRLFKPFDTTKGNAGMGIGVYESHEIIRGLGGSLEVSSEPGKGSIFTINLPCTEENIPTEMTDQSQ